MNVDRAAGVLLVAAPLWFNATFALLAKRFDYPSILRPLPPDILEAFRARRPVVDPPDLGVGVGEHLVGVVLVS